MEKSETQNHTTATVFGFKETVICKPDLDTCLTGYILHGREPGKITVVDGNASQQQLHDSKILCIECGESGNTTSGNFDHHDPSLKLPPACYQAWLVNGSKPIFEILVRYVCKIDLAEKIVGNVSFPSLSQCFSGMLLTVRSRVDQYREGLSILDTVLDKKIDPFATMPNLKQWHVYLQNKLKNNKLVEEAISRAQFVLSNTGAKIGYFESNAIGGLQRLYSHGCEIVIACNPAHGDQADRKFTISSQTLPVEQIIPCLNKEDPGWGGRDRIIGSPYTGSRLTLEQVVFYVQQAF